MGFLIDLLRRQNLTELAYSREHQFQRVPQPAWNNQGTNNLMPSWFSPYLRSPSPQQQAIPRAVARPQPAAPLGDTDFTTSRLQRTGPTGGYTPGDQPQGQPTAIQGGQPTAIQGGQPTSTGPAAKMAGSTFAQKAPGITQNLMRDFNLKDYQAAAIVGNLGHESGGFTRNQEIKPLRGRGGLGWAQWTGPRRVDYENYAKQNGLDPRSDDANYGFLKQEIGDKYKGTLNGLRNTNNAEEALYHWENGYEGARVKNYPSRMNYTNQALNLTRQATQPQDQNQTASQQPQGQNQTANQQPQSNNQYASLGSKFQVNGDTSKINPSLLNAIHAGSTHLPDGYQVVMSSGYRDPQHNAQVGGATHSHHTTGNAVDVKIIDPQGNALPNRNAGPETPYGMLARGMYHEISTSDPNLANQLRWGGNFNYHGFADSMHYDLGGSDHGQLAQQYKQYSPSDNFKPAGAYSQFAQNQQRPGQPNQSSQPTRVASLDPKQPLPGGQQQPTRPLAIGDSLAVGVGGIYGNTSYAHGGWNPQAVNGLVDKAIADGQVKGRPVVLSGGASNAGGNTNMVQQYYPQMIQKLQDAGASHVSVMGVGPYSHYDNYGYNKIIGDAAQNSGTHFTGPLADIAPFSGKNLSGGVHPNDYHPIVDHINQSIAAPPANVAQNQSSQQQASVSKPPTPTPSTQTVSQTAANTPSPASQQVASATPPSPSPSPSTPNSPPPQTPDKSPEISGYLPTMRLSHVQLSETTRRSAIQLLRPYK